MKLSNLDLNLLLVLHTVLEEKSVARAAARLHVTPPAVSNALARLRDLLGDPLLVRRGRGLVPTPRAMDLRPRLAAALGELERAVGDDARFDAATSRRRFVLACADGDQLASVPAVAARFARELPMAELQVVSIDHLVATDGLAAGTVDAALAPAGAPLEGLHTREVYSDEAVLLLRRGHPAASRPLTRERFNALRHVDIWLVLGRAGSGNQMAEAFFARHRLTRQIALIVPGFAPAAMITAQTDLVTGMPRRVAELFAQTLPVVVRPIPAPPLTFHMLLVWHPRTHEDPGARCFRELVATALASKPERSPPRKPTRTASRR